MSVVKHQLSLKGSNNRWSPRGVASGECYSATYTLEMLAAGDPQRGLLSVVDVFLEHPKFVCCQQWRDLQRAT
jgi:hypothetical protein